MFRGWLVVFATASACGGQPRAGRLGRPSGSARSASSATAIAATPRAGARAARGDRRRWRRSVPPDPRHRRIRAAYLKRGVRRDRRRAWTSPRAPRSWCSPSSRAGARRPGSRSPGYRPAVGAARAGRARRRRAVRYDARRRAPLVALPKRWLRAEACGRVDADPAGVATVLRDRAGPLCRFGASASQARGALEPAVRAAVVRRRSYWRRRSRSQGDPYELGWFDGARRRSQRRRHRHPCHRHRGQRAVPRRLRVRRRAGHPRARVRGGGFVPAAAPLITLAADARSR